MNLAEIRQDKGIHGFITGQTGTGKTFLAKYLLPEAGLLCVVDPKRKFDYPNLEIFNDVGQIYRRKPQRFIYRPHPTDLSNLRAYDDVYRFCYDRGDFFVYTDELVGVLKKQQFPDYLQACYCMGREVGITNLATSQRPARIPLFLISECEQFYAFTLSRKDDIMRIQEMVPGYETPLPDKHTFVYRNLYDDRETYIKLEKGAGAVEDPQKQLREERTRFHALGW